MPHPGSIRAKQIHLLVLAPITGAKLCVMHAFQTPLHARAAQVATEFLASCDQVDAVQVVGTSARRMDANDLDISALVAGEVTSQVEADFADFAQQRAEFDALAAVGPFVEVDFHAVSGEFCPGPRSWTTGPDSFELELGNELAYSVALWERNDRLVRLREHWLPFYNDQLRATRLADARLYAINDLDHVPMMVRRNEPFHAFHRLYFAFQGFLQALFITRRTYPISYDKWIREQVEGLLGLPELHAELPKIIGIDGLDLAGITDSADRLRQLLDQWTGVTVA